MMGHKLDLFLKGVGKKLSDYLYHYPKSNKNHQKMFILTMWLKGPTGNTTQGESHTKKLPLKFSFCNEAKKVAKIGWKLPARNF